MLLVLMALTTPILSLRPPAKPGEFYLAERLYPSSYSLPMRKYVGGDERAQWLADWRAIAECFARLQPRGVVDATSSWDQTRLATLLRDACSDELSFMPESVVIRSGQLPSPFALALVDAAFCAAHARPDRYARMREYTLAQYVPGRGADVSERLGAHRVAAVSDLAASARFGTSAIGRWFDPATPEYDAMVRCHNVEFPVKHPDWRSRGLASDLVLHEPFGVLRRGEDARNRDLELKMVLEAEIETESLFGKKDGQPHVEADAKDDEDRVFAEDWRVIDAQWLHRWLAFVHYNKQAPAPGPMRNEDLVYADENGTRVAASFGASERSFLVECPWP
ncbi:hypothetical protein CTAYLR_004370 [Chrysophaeum taylorii]|uniref:DUSP domain-containing protein n=1 Tax=Chrysophaeum taylorii TaxID=2483200 RepID=A0AAD7ULU5_9STRA|nr:hypothetical protein CTAYLR_004370 [Chrysophaeum taylorii]